MKLPEEDWLQLTSKLFASRSYKVNGAFPEGESICRIVKSLVKFYSHMPFQLKLNSSQKAARTVTSLHFVFVPSIMY